MSTTSSPFTLFSLPSKSLINISSKAAAAKALGRRRSLFVESVARVRNRLPWVRQPPSEFCGMSKASQWERDYGAMTHHVEKNSNCGSLKKKKKINHFAFHQALRPN